MAKVLVTGCAGFIGSHLCEKLIERGERVIGIDCLRPYYAPKIKEKNLQNLISHKDFKFIKKDLAALDLKKTLQEVDYIYHFAAQPGVRASWGGSFDSYLLDNVLATQKLLEQVKNLKIKKFIYASSSSIYGQSEKMPTTEKEIPHPISPYGITKLAGENLALCYFENYQVPIIALRFFTVYGPRQRPDMAFSRFLLAAKEGRTIEIYGDGSQTRNFTYVADAVEGTIRAAKSQNRGQVYNIGGGSQASVLSVLKLIRKITGKKLKIKFLPRQKGDPLHTSADIRKAQKAFGFSPRVSLEAGLVLQYQWLKEVNK